MHAIYLPQPGTVARSRQEKVYLFPILALPPVYFHSYPTGQACGGSSKSVIVQVLSRPRSSNRRRFGTLIPRLAGFPSSIVSQVVGAAGPLTPCQRSGNEKPRPHIRRAFWLGHPTHRP